MTDYFKGLGRALVFAGAVLAAAETSAGSVSSAVPHIVVSYDRMALDDDGLAAGEVVMDPAEPFCTMRREKPKEPCTVQLLPLYSRAEIREAIRLLDLIDKPGRVSCRAASFSSGYTITWKPGVGGGQRSLRVDNPCLAKRPGVKRIRALAKRALRIAHDLCN